MNTIDIILAVLLIFGFVRGLTKGLFVEVASLVSLIAGVYGAIHFSYFVANYLTDLVSWEERYITIVSFAVTFAAIVLVIALLGKMFTKIADFAALGIVNSILGGVFGVLKIGLILSIALIIFNKLNSTLPFISEETTKSSILYQPIHDLAPTLFPDFLTVTDK
ncbi:MAG: colicin V production protein [Flavobacteriaceae bacterium]|nr:MAG: colicin V production protein [Flavobacteriaceae bacterium]